MAAYDVVLPRCQGSSSNLLRGNWEVSGSLRARSLAHTTTTTPIYRQSPSSSFLITNLAYTASSTAPPSTQPPPPPNTRYPLHSPQSTIPAPHTPPPARLEPRSIRCPDTRFHVVAAVTFPDFCVPLRHFPPASQPAPLASRPTDTTPLDPDTTFD